MVVKKDKRIIEKKIREYINILKEDGIPIWRLYLFGSYLSNKFMEESDIDLAVFFDKTKIDIFKEDLKLMRLRRKIDLRIEPHSFTKSDFLEPDPFVKQILNKGKRII